MCNFRPSWATGGHSLRSTATLYDRNGGQFPRYFQCRQRLNQGGPAATHWRLPYVVATATFPCVAYHRAEFETGLRSGLRAGTVWCATALYRGAICCALYRAGLCVTLCMILGKRIRTRLNPAQSSSQPDLVSARNTSSRSASAVLTSRMEMPAACTAASTSSALVTLP